MVQQVKALSDGFIKTTSKGDLTEFDVVIAGSPGRCTVWQPVQIATGDLLQGNLVEGREYKGMKQFTLKDFSLGGPEMTARPVTTNGTGVAPAGYTSTTAVAPPSVGVPLSTTSGRINTYSQAVAFLTKAFGDCYSLITDTIGDTGAPGAAVTPAQAMAVSLFIAASRDGLPMAQELSNEKVEELKVLLRNFSRNDEQKAVDAARAFLEPLGKKKLAELTEVEFVAAKNTFTTDVPF